MGNQLPPWDARKRVIRYRPAAEEVRRALDPATGLPFQRLTFPQKLKLNTMSHVLKLAAGWVGKRLAAYLTGLAVLIGATADDAQHTAQFLTVLFIFGAEALLKIVRVKWMQRTAPITPPAALLLLLLLAVMLPGLTACRSTAQRESAQFEAWLKAGQEQAEAEADAAAVASLLLAR